MAIIDMVNFYKIKMINRYEENIVKISSLFSKDLQPTDNLLKRLERDHEIREEK